MNHLQRLIARVSVAVGLIALFLSAPAHALTLGELHLINGIIQQLASAGPGYGIEGTFSGDLAPADESIQPTGFSSDALGTLRYNTLLHTLTLSFHYAGNLVNGTGIGGSLSHTYHAVETLITEGHAYLVSYAPAANVGDISALISNGVQTGTATGIDLDAVGAPNAFSTLPAELAAALAESGRSINVFVELAPSGALSAWWRTPLAFDLNVGSFSGAHRLEDLVLNGHLRPSPEVPEPFTGALVVVGAGGAICGRRIRRAKEGRPTPG